MTQLITRSWVCGLDVLEVILLLNFMDEIKKKKIRKTHKTTDNICLRNIIPQFQHKWIILL